MLCEQCHKNEATFHRVQVTNGKRTETHLCAQCLSAYEGAVNVGGMIASLLTPIEFVTPAALPTCGRCGTTPARFQQTGRLGCSQCYTDLDQMIEPMLKRVQGRSRHVGRAPFGHKQAEPENPVLELRRQIAEAIAKEDYETAAQMRDEIRKLERDGREA